MWLMPAEAGLVPIFVAVLLGPLFIKRIERNIEAFLLFMGSCAIVISGSWHIGLVEDAVRQPLVVGIVLAGLVAGMIAHHRRMHLSHAISSLLSDPIAVKVMALEVVVVSGLSAIIVTPALPFFMLVEAVNHLPLVRRNRAAISLLGGMSILFGALLAPVDGLGSTIASAKMQGALPSADIVSLGLQNLYLMAGILVLGLVGLLLVGEEVRIKVVQPMEKSVATRSMAIWSARVCMFAGALLLIGVAYGVSV